MGKTLERKGEERTERVHLTIPGRERTKRVNPESKEKQNYQRTKYGTKKIGKQMKSAKSITLYYLHPHP